MRRSLSLSLAALAAAACSPDFTPASRVEGLRVLAIRADPPEIAPAPASGTPVAPDRAALTTLVVRADYATDPTRQTTVLYLACVPVPGDPTPSPCVALAGLRDPTEVLAQAAQASCAAGGDAPAIAFAGVEVCEGRACGPVTVGGVTLPSPELVLPAGYGFDALPPGAPERALGVQAELLAFALDATPDELAAGGVGACPAADVAPRIAALWAARDHVLAVKRVWIRGPEAPDAPNVNPAIDDVAAGGVSLPDVVAPGTHWLAPLLAGGRRRPAPALHRARRGRGPHRAQARGVGLLLVQHGGRPRGPPHRRRRAGGVVRRRPRGGDRRGGRARPARRDRVDGARRDRRPVRRAGQTCRRGGRASLWAMTSRFSSSPPMSARLSSSTWPSA